METNETLESPTQTEPVETPTVEVVESPDPMLMSQPQPGSKTSDSWQEGQATISESLTLLRQFLTGINQFIRDNKPLLTAIALIILASIALKIVLAILGTLDEIPLASLLLKSFGLGYFIWFANRYLLRASSREQLAQEFHSYKEQFWGSQPLLPSAKTSADDSQPESTTGMTVQKSVMIHQSPEDLYRFWRDFENLPHFMHHIESVKSLDEKRSHWVAKAPLGTHVEWDAEILNEEQPKTIVWRSLPGADVDSVGSVAFTEANGSGTEVKVTMEYNPPGGAVGATVAAIFGENPEQQLEEDLNRFKQLMETAAVPST
ncbi:CAAD domain-containing protein [Merismopedia glauca]|uniref:Cyclase n=1 Tax=Merismopedia glauca CCAP 1448/3 TaxID=1296344 RepID=A0A2T1C6Q2_9CYAN|nr:CAAD domain-containing protein [Merismopedia glauca]PSB03817.1 hypothetical protein C7B64_06815 [Merismopedia glauca CCAP 1448/3]